MRAQGGGLIVNIGSIGGLTGIAFQAAFSASKFGLEGLTEALRLESGLSASASSSSSPATSTPRPPPAYGLDARRLGGTGVES